MEKIAFTTAAVGALSYLGALTWAHAVRPKWLEPSTVEICFGLIGFAAMVLGVFVGTVCWIWS